MSSQSQMSLIFGSFRLCGWQEWEAEFARVRLALLEGDDRGGASGSFDALIDLGVWGHLMGVAHLNRWHPSDLRHHARTRTRAGCLRAVPAHVPLSC